MLQRLHAMLTGNIRRAIISIIVFAMFIPMVVIISISLSSMAHSTFQSAISENRQVIRQISKYFELYFNSVDSMGLDIYRSTSMYNALISPRQNPKLSLDEKDSFFFTLLTKNPDAVCLHYHSLIDDYEATCSRQVRINDDYVLRVNHKHYFDSFYTVNHVSLPFESPAMLYPHSTPEADFTVYYRVIYNVLRKEPVGELYIIFRQNFLAETCGFYTTHPQDALALYSMDSDSCLYANNAFTPELLQACEPLFHQAGESVANHSVSADGLDRLAFLTRLPKSDIVVCKAVSKESIQLDVSRTLLLLIPVAVLAILLAIAFSRSIARPIGRLREAMQRVQHGEYGLQIHSDSLTGNEIVSAVHAFNLMTSEIDRLINESLLARIRLQQARINELQATINPHFISNTLQSISGMAVRHNAYDVRYALEIFSDLMRYCISGDTSGVSLRAELDHACKYLTLHKLRLGDRLTFLLESTPEAESVIVPRLTLQPLIENCIVHGLDASDRPLNIAVYAAMASGALCLSVCDDGAGFRESPILNQESCGSANQSADSEHRHIGLNNIYERLCHMYGDRCQMKMDSEPYKTTCICITIQMKEETGHEAADRR